MRRKTFEEAGYKQDTQFVVVSDDAEHPLGTVLSVLGDLENHFIALTDGEDFWWYDLNSVGVTIKVIEEGRPIKAQPKINMTRELPSEEGLYFWCDDMNSAEYSMNTIPVINTITHGKAGLLAHLRDGKIEFPSIIGGYWAKVDKSMFEFEGENNA